MNSMIK